MSVRELRRVPGIGRRRWYELTPSLQTACPVCGELVVFTFVTPLIVVPFALPLVVILGGILVPQVHAAFTSIPTLKFGVTLLVGLVSGYVLTAAVKKAKLKRGREL